MFRVPLSSLAAEIDGIFAAGLVANIGYNPEVHGPTTPVKDILNLIAKTPGVRKHAIILEGLLNRHGLFGTERQGLDSWGVTCVALHALEAKFSQKTLGTSPHLSHLIVCSPS